MSLDQLQTIANFGFYDAFKFHHIVMVNIPIAYVMGSKKKHFSPLHYEDIGLLLTTKEKYGKGVRFYPHNQPSGSINIGSVCLAAEKKDAPHMYDGKVMSVGWGTRYSDVKDTQGEPRQDEHSCSTNEYGPTFGKLRHCDVNDITRSPNNWGCNRSDKPKGYDAVKCKKYLDQAEKGFEEEIMKLGDQDLLTTLWSLANKIEISSSLFHSKQVCYKQKLFDDDGWCYVTDRYNTGANGNGWGFCSSSCKLMQVQIKRPSTYHMMVWEYPFKLPPRCYDNVHDNPDPSKNTKPYYLCTASFLPQTIVLKFKKAGKSKLKLSDVYNEKIEDTFDANDVQTMKERGYQLPCKADSGSGHWMYASSENKRAALVAMVSHSQGKFCGDSIHNLLTTYPTILKWIKTYSGISNP